MDVAKAKRFYPGIEVGGRISFYLWGTTLELADILNFDMVNTNLLNRAHLFTNPSEPHKIFGPYCVRAGQGVYEFVPRKFTPPLDYLPDWPWPPEWYEETDRHHGKFSQQPTNLSCISLSLTTRTCYREPTYDQGGQPISPIPGTISGTILLIFSYFKLPSLFRENVV